MKPRVLLVGIDGCRPDGMRAAETPNLDSLLRSAGFSFEAQTNPLTKSGPSWASMLTGVWSDKHGVTGNSMEGSRFDRYPHLFTRLKQVFPEARTATFVHWAPINDSIVTDADFSNEFDTSVAVAEAAEKLMSLEAPDVTFLHFDDVDHAGHFYGYGPNPDYLAAISGVDALIGRVLGVIMKRSVYSEEDWLIIVGTDHGGDDVKEPGAAKARHGDDVPEHRTVFLIVSGRSVARGTIEPPPVTVDVPPTIFAHLGIAVDPKWGWDGRPLAQRLDG